MTTSQEMISDLIEARRMLLSELAAAVSGSEALHCLLSDPPSESEARDAVVEDQIIAIYPRLNLICLLSPDGKVIAANTVGGRLQASLIHTNASAPRLGAGPARVSSFSTGDAFRLQPFRGPSLYTALPDAGRPDGERSSRLRRSFPAVFRHTGSRRE
jgi:hypothetical protein